MKIDKNSVVLPLPGEEIYAYKENKWRVKLPESYKKFIGIYNGGIPFEKSFLCNSRNYAIERFLCILKDPKENPFGVYDISVVLTQIGERLTANEDLLGAEVLPIASLFAGDFICLDFRDKQKEASICVWSHEESGEFAPITYRVADNFNDFINMVK